MKYNILSTLLLLSTISFAQTHHELKVDLFRALASTAFVSYEWAPKKHFGMELGLGHKWDRFGFFSGMPEPDTYQGFERRIGQLFLGSKCYIGKKANADRWFVGGYFLEEYELYRDPGYNQAYLTTFGRAASGKKNVRSGLGAMGGFKKVFKNNLILELGMDFNVDMAALFASNGQSSFDFGGYYDIKVGYRFPSRPSVKKEEK